MARNTRSATDKWTSRTNPTPPANTVPATCPAALKPHQRHSNPPHGPVDSAAPREHHATHSTHAIFDLGSDALRLGADDTGCRGAASGWPRERCGRVRHPPSSTCSKRGRRHPIDAISSVRAAFPRDREHWLPHRCLVRQRRSTVLARRPVRGHRPRSPGRRSPLRQCRATEPQGVPLGMARDQPRR